MQRIPLKERENWKEKVRESGLLYIYTPEGLYWNEGAYYSFTKEESEKILEVTNELHELCLKAVQFVIDQKRFEEFSIPPEAVPLIVHSWESGERGVYGRFDLSYGGEGTEPKLLEYNADTPTSLLESSVIQDDWRAEVFPDKGQINTLHPKLVRRWRLLNTTEHFERLNLAAVESVEDMMNVAYHEACATEAGIHTHYHGMRDITWDEEGRVFVDDEGIPIQNLFKLYPWEWIVKDKFGKRVISTWGKIRWIEPIWKMLLSNKAILPVLWELNPHHPNLLECYSDGPRGMKSYVAKPILSREGANIEVVVDGTQSVKTDGEYGEERKIYQAFAALPDFSGRRAVVGSWVVGDEAAGVGIRESDSLVTDNYSQFVPHIVE
jgi:glutathionylspermidine synthase